MVKLIQSKFLVYFKNLSIQSLFPLSSLTFSTCRMTLIMNGDLCLFMSRHYYFDIAQNHRTSEWKSSPRDSLLLPHPVRGVRPRERKWLPAVPPWQETETALEEMPVFSSSLKKSVHTIQSMCTLGVCRAGHPGIVPR